MCMPLLYPSCYILVPCVCPYPCISPRDDKWCFVCLLSKEWNPPSKIRVTLGTRLSHLLAGIYRPPGLNTSCEKRRVLVQQPQAGQSRAEQSSRTLLSAPIENRHNADSCWTRRELTPGPLTESIVLTEADTAALAALPMSALPLSQYFVAAVPPPKEAARDFDADFPVHGYRALHQFLPALQPLSPLLWSSPSSYPLTLNWL